MRILHVVSSIDPAAGGPTEAIHMLVRHAPPGYQAELVTLDNPEAPFLRDLEFPVHALGSARHRWFSPRLLPWLRANRHRFDGAIVHGLWQYTGFAAMRALHGRIPYVVFAHGMLDPWFKRTFPVKHWKKWLYWLPAEYWVLRRAQRVLFTTALERDLAAQSFALHHWHPLVAPLGTESPPADRDTLAAAFRQHMPDAGLADRRFLLFLGRLHPKKGCDLLVQAFGEVTATHPDVSLVMAGPDPENWQPALVAMLPAEARSRVHWPGMLRGAAKWGAFAACEAFILPSHQENFGIAVVEALASGKPALLTTPINIAPDLDQEGCALVEPDTLDGTRRLLTRWLNLSPEERDVMGTRAFSTFQQHYDMRRNTEMILRLFETLPPARVALAHTPHAEIG